MKQTTPAMLLSIALLACACVSAPPPPMPVKDMKPAVPAAAPMPAPVLVPAAPPAETKPPAPPPPPAPPKRCDANVTLQSDQTFTFGKDVLSDAAKTRLDEVLTRAAACGKLEIIVVTGYTDRLGSPLDNQKLSERRAQAVKAQLVAKGLSAELIDAVGAGKTLQVKECSDTLKRTELIECLAPNRRVAIDIRGIAK
jgi:OmpA-OmpF porin, OOP family